MSFALSPNEVRSDGLPRLLSRVIDEQLELAIRALAEQEADPVEAVHDARKALKRVRTTLRLCIRFLGKPAMKEHSQAVRAVAHKLTSIRDAQMLDDALRKLDESCSQAPNGEGPEGPKGLEGSAGSAGSEGSEGPEGPDTRLDTPYAEVVRRVRATYAESPRPALSDEELGSIIAGLIDLRTRLAALLSERQSAGAFSRTKKRLRKLTSGVRRILRRGKDALSQVLAEPGSAPTAADDLFHALRKRVKDYYYAVSLLEPGRPKKIGALAKELDELADVLGDEHDLTVLADRAHEEPARFGGVVPVALLLQLIARRKDALRAKARRGASLLLFGKQARPPSKARLKQRAHWLTSKLFEKKPRHAA